MTSLKSFQTHCRSRDCCSPHSWIASGRLVALQLLLHRTAYWYLTWQKALLWTAYAILSFLTVQCFRDRVSLKRLSIFFAVFGYLVALFAIAQEFAGNGKIYWVVPDQSGMGFFGPYANHAHYAGRIYMLGP